MDLNNLNIKIDVTPRFNPPNQIMRDFRINALHVSTESDLDLTEHGKALFQEYIDSARYEVSFESPEHPRCLCYMPRIESRRKRAHCNSRIKMVQAKRKALDLAIDGKCCLLRTRKASLALRLAEQDWYDGRRSEQPHRGEFEHRTARVRRKEKRRALKWKLLEMSPYEKWWINAQEEERARVEQTFEEIAWATDAAVSTAKGAFITVFNAYGKEEAGNDRKP